MAKDISKVMIHIEDDAGWESLMETSESKLVIVDIHQEWCGCCEAIHPSISRVLIDYDECEERFQYAAASIAKVGENIKNSLPSDSNIDLQKNGCLPLFGIYRNKTCLMVVVGVDSPTLLQQISMNIPDKPVQE
mmetsp:Transcript_112988/g.319602  ORF Transcript_112988/g.319602 Transcript_112988/m.319602 type:complete len:134 (+) Transcript_112988:34-435(+)